MFSNMKKEEYMESELSGNFQGKVVPKNIVFGSLGPNAELLCSMMSIFEETYKPNCYT